MKEKLPDAWIKKIFQVMHANYGSKWLRMWMAGQVVDGEVQREDDGCQHHQNPQHPHTQLHGAAGQQPPHSPRKRTGMRNILR